MQFMKNLRQTTLHLMNNVNKHTQIFLATLSAAFVVKMFVVDAVYVPSHSMEQTLLPGDYVLVNKLVYGATTPKHVPFSHSEFPFFRLPKLNSINRGDVIVFEVPAEVNPVLSSQTIYYVKRCIGIGGDTVKIENGTVSVNGKSMSFPAKGNVMPMSKNEIDRRLFPQGAQFNIDNYGPIVIPKRGDSIHLTEANYSQWETLIRREGHCIERRAPSEIFIDGKPMMIYEIEKNYLFVLGDNRHQSYDSRFWGFLPEESVVGEAIMVYWSCITDIQFRALFDRFASVRWNRIGNVVR
jgi:signal peptidase I